ncbi:protein AATF-like [Tubulanus polymorphus]|uniref:protein AATF-like n=1 Tax=Tubulanus polymorphus TaxID=672921 RepID=UPI003DA265AE
MSFAEELAKLVNPTPVFDDPEDSFHPDSKARLCDPVAGDDEDNDDGIALAPSSLRRKTLNLDDFGESYAGKKTSRKKLNEDSDFEDDDSDDDVNDEDLDDDISDENGEQADEDDSEDDESEAGDSDDDGDDENDDDLASFKTKMKLTENKAKASGHKFSFSAHDDYSKYADDDENETSEMDDDDDDDGNDDSNDDDVDSEMDDGEDIEPDDEGAAERDGEIEKFSKTNVTDEIARGKAAQAQLSLWDSFLECRIKLQKILLLTNQLPQPDAWDEIIASSGPDDEIQTAAKQCHAMFKTLLDELYVLQTSLLLRHPDTEHIGRDGESNPEKNKDVDDDDEIPSDSDVGEEDDDDREQKKVSLSSLRKRKYDESEYPELLSKRHKKFQTYRNEVIQKWNDKTRVSSGKVTSKSFSAFDQPVLKQINQILADRDRLLKRTQLKRSAYQIIGKVADSVETVPDSEQQSTEFVSRDHLNDYDPEIFDDNDFYHQLLRELIERKTSAITDPVALSRQWMEIQKLRSKMKKKVDTKASKGRKIRYDVHPKLVNFMAPVDNSTWSDETRNELFSSLFGKRFADQEATPILR